MNTTNKFQKNCGIFYPGILALSCALFSGASAAEVKTDFSFEAGAGMQHDSNLSIQELDRAQNTGDSAFLLNTDLQGKITVDEAFTVKGGYRHQWKNYQTFEEFDQRTATWSVDARYDFTALTLGASAHRADAALDSEPFLTLVQSSVYAGKLIGGRVYLRGALGQRDKNFSDNPLRDAKADIFDGDMFVFFAGAQSYFSLGAGWEREDAASESLDFNGRSLRARLSHKFALAGTENTLQLGGRLSEREYVSEFSLMDTPLDSPNLPWQEPAVTPTDKETRRDLRRTLDASWELAFNEALSVTGKLSHGNHSSPLAGADYDETLASLMLNLRF